MRRRLTALSVTVVLLTLLSQTGLRGWLWENCLDLCFRLRGHREPPQSIVLVVIDEKSLDALGAWPFPRSLHARLLSRLAQSRAVGFDILFSEPTDEDDLLAEAIVHGPPVVLASAHDVENEPLLPIPSLAQVSTSGHIDSLLGGNGILRSTWLRQPDGQAVFGAALAHAGGLIDALPLPDKPTLINFYGPEQSFLHLSYVDVLDGKYDPDFFRDRLVLIGAQASGLGDVHISPFSRSRPMPGVEVQATLTANILTDTFIRPISWLVWTTVLLILVLSVFIWPRFGEAANLAIGLALGLTLLLLASALFRTNRFFDFLEPLAVLAISYLVHLITQGLWLTREVLEDIRRVDQQLENQLHQVHIGQSRPPGNEAGGLHGHLERMRETVRALTLQHHFINHLLREEIPPLILWSAETGELVLANSSFATFWQQQAGETLPALAKFRRFLDDHRLRLGGAAEAENPQDADREELEIETLNTGGRQYLRVLVHPVLSEETGFRGVLALLTDVTAIRTLERLKDEVVSIVSHELKLPLTTILGYGEMLAMESEGEQQAFAAEICRQTRRMNGMIESFLDIARLESGRRRVQHRPYSLLTVAEDAVRAVSAAAAAKQIALETSLPSHLTTMQGDEALLLQALINLLDNAIKFSPPGTTVRLALTEEPDSMTVAVADQGPGIPPGEEEAVFGKFHRGSDQEKRDGFGLGLALVKQVVESHGGRVHAAANPGGGALFTLSLSKTPR